MIRLNGRKALITGGSRGIGRATALLFARAGCDVAINYASRQRGGRRQSGTGVEEHGPGMPCLQGRELSSKSDVEDMVADILSRWGELDTVVNNAGVWTYLEMGRMDESVYRETMGVNVDGVFYVTNAVVPSMKKKGRGWIINVTSTAGVRGEALHSHYAASKGALDALTKSLAVELAPYQYPGQQRGPRLGRYRHVHGGFQRARHQGEGPPVHPPQADPAARRTSPGPSSSWRPTSRGISPARS